MTVHFTIPQDKVIHSFQDYPKGWIADANGIDRCSICGVDARSPVIVRYTFKFRTRFRTYVMCVKPID